ncbi:MAG: Uma2 family endonuclease [Planctomycetota bacterium]|nr:Uma2 family endonuclease [Planctomycetota bacterium]
MTRAGVKHTVDDYRALPEGGPRYQLIEGELVPMTPAPSFRHQALVSELVSRLRPFVRSRGLGDVVASPIDVYLGEHDVFQPDVLFVSTARADRIAQDGVRGAPDLVVEVLSPSTRHLDLGHKKRAWARHGVIEYWVVDPEDETLTVYELQGGRPEGRTRSQGVIESSLLPGFSLDVREYFQAA